MTSPACGSLILSPYYTVIEGSEVDPMSGHDGCVHDGGVHDYH